jgi:hypothetical protein
VYATHDSDDEAGCVGVGYNGDGVDKKTRLNKNIPEKRDAPINHLRNMASNFFNWEYTLPFNTTPRTEKDLCKLAGLC